MNEAFAHHLSSCIPADLLFSPVPLLTFALPCSVLQSLWYHVKCGSCANLQKRKKDKDKGKDKGGGQDAPMQYSKFLKGAYDSSSDEEVLQPLQSFKCAFYSSSDSVVLDDHIYAWLKIIHRSVEMMRAHASGFARLYTKSAHE